MFLASGANFDVSRAHWRVSSLVWIAVPDGLGSLQAVSVVLNVVLEDLPNPNVLL